jgi:AcrR family transcriptional regulator
VQDSALPVSSRGRATRERLVRAAREVFEEVGFVDARITHITKTAKVAYGSFYTHFSSKEEIFYEVASRLFEEMFAPDDTTFEGDTPRSRLDHANRVYWERYQQRARMMAIVEQVATIDPDFRDLRQQHRKQTTDRTARSIQHWQEQGLVPHDLDAQVAAQALGAMVDRTLYLRFVLGETDHADTALDTVNLLTIRALGLDRD